MPLGKYVFSLSKFSVTQNFAYLLKYKKYGKINKKKYRKAYLGHFCQWAALNTGNMGLLCMIAVYLNLSMPSPHAYGYALLQFI